jgi:hypothetical protein
MAWKPLIAADVQERLTASELTALKTAAIAGSQTSAGIIAAAIERVTNQVRGYVAGCHNNTLGEAGTIPDELESAALAMIRRELFTRLPGMKGLFDEPRQQEAKDALQLMRDVAACRFAIVPPASPAPEAEQAGGTGVVLINSRERIATRETMAGL